MQLSFWNYPCAVWDQDGGKILLFQRVKKVNVLIRKQVSFDIMAQIRETIEALCTILNNYCPDKVSAENFRQAKFDKEEATVTLWETLHAVLWTESLKPVGKSDHDVVNFCKHKMFHKGYRVKDFFLLPEDMSHGSRELMLALGWLMAKEDVVTKFINKLEPLIFEDPPMDLPLYDKIPLPTALDDFTKQKDSKTSVDVAERLILNYNKIYSSLKSLLASKNEYTKIVCKLHTIPKTSKSQSLSHFLSQDIYFLRHPQKLAKYQERLEWFCHYTKALVFWSLNELTFWKWMESVLDAKAQNDSKTEDEIEKPDGGQQNELFKPSRALQKAKEHHVEFSQVLNAQETVYRKVSKCWKKLEANLQQSCDKRHENLSELLSTLDHELLLEIKELQKDFKDSQVNLRDMEPRPVSLCFKKLIQPDSKTVRASKEISNKSMASQEIARLTQEKEALEVKLRNLKEKHREKLFQISQKYPNLVCISSDLRGNTL